MTRKSCVVGIPNAILRSHLNSNFKLTRFPNSGWKSSLGQVWTLFWQSWRCYDNVIVGLAKLTLFVQSVNIIRAKLSLSLRSRRCPCKVDVVRTKCEHYSCKVVVVLAKLTLFVQSVNIIRTKLSSFFAQSFPQRKKKVGKLILI